MAQTSAGTGPIPPAKKDDTEDVAWALSTAEAMFARGDRGDALKWLRRAAEAASEAQADDRALELAKAAADLASILSPATSAPPPPPPPPPAASVAPPARAPTPGQTPLPARAASPSAPPPPPPPKSSPSRMQGTPPKPRALSPFAPTGAPPGPARRTRRSRPEITIARPPDEVTQSMATDEMPSPHPPEPRRRGRGSRPEPDEVTPLAAQAVPPSEPTPAPERETVPGDVITAALSRPIEEMDAWPTQSLVGDDLADPPDEKTRIGVPAYEASARLASEASVIAPLAPLVSPPQVSSDPALRPSQAVRVVVWRAADGVHVAPQGTRVAAISVDAVLVALDPSADLACMAVAGSCHTSIDECRGLLSGMNDAGRQKVLACAVSGCRFGLWSCVEGI